MSGSPLILVVDDFSDNREMYAEYLRYAGFRVDEATNGREALDKAAQNVPDAIVMDLSLPEMDGTAFLKVLAERALRPGLPVILISASPDLAEIAEQLGTEGYLPKPLNFPTLLQEVARLVGQ